MDRPNGYDDRPGHRDNRTLDERRERRDTGDELVRDLGRIGVELARGISAHVLAKMEEDHQKHAERFQRRWESKLERKLARHQRHRERHLARRQAKRERRYGSTSRAEAVVLAALAVLFLGFAAVQPQYWWVVFIGLGLGLRAARIFGYQGQATAQADLDAQRQEIESHEEELKSRDPRLARVDETCDKLVGALKDAPKSVREFLSQPEQTVEALRKTAHELLSREAALRALASPEDEARLATERDGLTQRIAAETDAVTRDRLQKALAALDERRHQTDEIRRQASRLDAENTRLSYTLEGLYAQVLRMKTAGATDAGEGLKASLDKLRAEVGALADALEDTGRASEQLVGATGPVTFDETPATDAPSGVRE